MSAPPNHYSLHNTQIAERLSYAGGMPQRSTPPPRRPPRAANDQTSDPPPRTWVVRMIRKKATTLGYVTAPDQQTAEAAAAELFELTAEQRKRLFVREYR